MAKAKAATGKGSIKKSNSRIKYQKKPAWMQVTKVITIIILSILMLFAIAGYIMKYYHLISNHK